MGNYPSQRVEGECCFAGAVFIIMNESNNQMKSTSVDNCPTQTLFALVS